MFEEKSVLIVDDEEDIRRIITQEILMQRTAIYRPLVATDGYEALNLMRREDVAVVVLDIRMKNLNGLEVCRMAASDEKMKKIPIIISSGYLKSGDKKDLQELGISEFLDKPYTLDELIERLDKITGYTSQT